MTVSTRFLGKAVLLNSTVAQGRVQSLLGSLRFWEPKKKQTYRELLMEHMASPNFSVTNGFCDHPDDHPDVKEDRAFMLGAVKVKGEFLQYATKELRADRELALAAVSQEGTSLTWVDKKLWEDDEIVRTAVREQRVYPFFGWEKNNHNVSIAALIEHHDDPATLRSVPERLLDDEMFIHRLVETFGAVEGKAVFIAVQKAKSDERAKSWCTGAERHTEAELWEKTRESPSFKRRIDQFDSVVANQTSILTLHVTDDGDDRIFSLSNMAGDDKTDLIQNMLTDQWTLRDPTSTTGAMISEIKQLARGPVRVMFAEAGLEENETRLVDLPVPEGQTHEDLI